jgi:O-acetyl-ADP-ribose deacetylase (regulator of RNase III)
MAKTRTYRLGHSNLRLIFGDVTTSEAQVLVSSDDYYLSMGGGVSAALRRAGGDAIVIDASKKVPAQLGEVVVTTAGALPADYIFHVVTIGPQGVTLPVKELVSTAVAKCLRLLDAMNLHSIAFPAIGTGAARLPVEEVAFAMSEAVSSFARDSSLSLEIEIYLFDRFGDRTEMDYAAFFEELAVRVPLASPTVAQQLAPAPATRTPPSSPEEELLERRNHLRQLVAKLERQRQKLEQELVDAHIASDEEELKRIRVKLKDNELLRLNYLSELREDLSASSKAPTSVKTVFLSSTYIDLVDCRLKVKDEILKLQFTYSGMEWFGADPISPASRIVEAVRMCDVYVGIIGVRYGSIDDATGISMTELEYQTAVTSGKPIHMYVIHNDAPITAAMIESDPASYAKLQTFRERVLKAHTVFRYHSAEELARQVAADLRQYVK